MIVGRPDLCEFEQLTRRAEERSRERHISRMRHQESLAEISRSHSNTETVVTANNIHITQ